MGPLIEFLDLHLQPSIIFGVIGVIALLTIAIITFLGFDD